MTSMSRIAFATPMAALLALAVPAQAEQHGLTEQEVRAYFDQIEQEATEMVRSDEIERMVEWIEQNIAEGAEFQVSMNILLGEERKGFASLTLDKDDMRQMGGLMAGAFRQLPIEDYELDIEVAEVTPVGQDAATVRATWTESFAISVPQGEGAEAANGQRLSAEAVVDCVQIVQRDGDRLMMGLMTCIGETRM